MFFYFNFNSDNYYFYVSGTKICKFKALDKTHPHYFCLGTASKRFTKDEIKKISLKGAMYMMF